MRRTAQGLITACAGLVAGAAFGATPALAGPGWWPPGHVLGYYGTLSDCGGYASSLSLWDDDYDCNYLPQRVAMPYVLVIQRPVQIVQPAEPVVADEPAPADEEPAPVADEPAPADEEPTGGALADKPVKAHKSHKAAKAHKATKAQGQAQGQMMSEEPTSGDDRCADVVPVCGDGPGVLAVPMAAPVQVVPVGGPVIVGGPYAGPWGGVGPWGGHRHPWH